MTRKIDEQIQKLSVRILVGGMFFAIGAWFIYEIWSR